MNILCRAAGKGGGAKPLREWNTRGGNADITRVCVFKRYKSGLCAVAPVFGERMHSLSTALPV